MKCAATFLSAIGFVRNVHYYMASSVSGQDEPIRARVFGYLRSRWSYLARSGLPAVSCKKNFPESHIINSLKLVRSRWLDIGLVLSLERVFGTSVMHLHSVSVHKYQKKKKKTWPISSHIDLTLGQQPIFIYMTSSVSRQDEPNPIL